MGDLFNKYLDALLMIDDNPRSQRRWRFLTSLAIFFVVFHVAWACNQIPGLTGFARAEEVETVKKDILGVKIQLLEKDIFDTRMQQCKATNKEFFTRRLQELLRAYWDLTHVDMSTRMPSCGDF